MFCCTSHPPNMRYLCWKGHHATMPPSTRAPSSVSLAGGCSLPSVIAVDIARVQKVPSAIKSSNHYDKAFSTRPTRPLLARIPINLVVGLGRAHESVIQVHHHPCISHNLNARVGLDCRGSEMSLPPRPNPALKR